LERLRLISYLAPSIPARFFTTIAERIGGACGVVADVEFNETISGPLEGDDEPFSSGAADVGFVCAPTYRYFRERVPGLVELLPAPVPLDPRADQRPVYFADVVVREDSPVTRFEELRGKVWSYNDPNSRSGWFSMLERVSAIGPGPFFGELVRAGSHLESIAKVLRGEADAAAIDSNALRQRRDGLRILESWGPFAIQPTIIRGALDRELKASVAKAMLEIDEETLAEFGFRRFARVDDAMY